MGFFKPGGLEGRVARRDYGSNHSQAEVEGQYRRDYLYLCGPVYGRAGRGRHRYAHPGYKRGKEVAPNKPYYASDDAEDEPFEQEKRYHAHPLCAKGHQGPYLSHALEYGHVHGVEYA